ncbi:MAG: hypothetical protein KAT61_05550 [Gammaproteobacteria bacterium]|nr:hypothetical protein [Gammaproteobacteria bacterium]
MSEELFDVVFFGILQSGKDKEIVMQNMATLFKTDASKLAAYFSGGRKVIKGKINAETAGKYRAALENVGLVIKVEPCDIAQNTEQSETQQGPEKTAKGSTQSDNTKANTGNITIAPVGANVTENPVAVPAQKIADISDVTMAAAGANIIENPVTIATQKIEDISGITMAEAGSNVLEHPVEVIAQKIDELSNISLAEAGADIIENPKTKEKADIPDTSELSLDDNKG